MDSGGHSGRGRLFAGSLAVLLAIPLALGTGAGSAAADPTPAPEPSVAEAHDGSDELPNPAEAERRELADQALQEVLSGDRQASTRNGSRVVKMGTKPAPLTPEQQSRVRRGETVRPASVDAYVELTRARTDKIFVVLVEFGDEREPRYPDTDTNSSIPGPARFDGPLHNAIPAPDRRVDNTTIWRRDFGPDYYRQLYFGAGESLKSYYERQSSGRYSVEGQVSDWVKVPYNEARYGRSNGYPCAENVCGNTWFLIRDALEAWVADQRAAGRSDTEIAEALASYDAWDRYDHDGDGNFNEPDGYLDHFQIVHAGGDQSEGDRYQGEDAIWSHRWKAFQCGTGVCPGPAGNPDGGVQIGGTGLWVADYTIQAENAGLSVFAHEYGHDLGLPDHYDTADPGDNPVNWWTLMGQSRLKARRDVGVGTRPGDLGVWDKLALGWLNYTLVDAGQPRTLELGPHEYNSAKPQAVIVRLPQKSVETPLPAPAEGDRQWWSGARDATTSTLTRRVVLPAGAAQLTFSANVNIEDCGASACDYAYVEVNDGRGFVPIAGSITSAAEGNGIAGSSGGWVPASFDLSAYAGRTVDIRFRYSTNACIQGAVSGEPAGLLVDDIEVTAGGETVLADGAEAGTTGWVVNGFRNVGRTGTDAYNHYYLASNRSYVSYDSYLRTGPYNFGWQSTRPLKAEFFPYADGLLVNYWDTQYCDNNTSQHPGHGRILPVDAHPAPLLTRDGQPWRGRIQTYDAPFSLQRTDPLLLHNNGRPTVIRGRPAQPVFDDTRSYWSPVLPRVGVKVAGLGVTLRVTKQSGTSMTVDLGQPASASSATAGR